MKEIVEEKREGMLFLTLNRPEKRNALSLSLMRSLSGSIKKASSEKDVRLILIQGSGPSFCSGLDLQEACKKDTANLLYDEAADLFQTIYNSPLTTLCKAQGYIYAGGVGLVAACDYVLAESSATFCLPEIKKGLVPALVAQLLKRQIPIRHVREMSLLGRPFGCPEALKIGLINRAETEKDMEKALAEVVNEFMQADPAASSLFKELLRTSEDPSLKEDFKIALEYGKKARELSGAEQRIGKFIHKKS